LFVKFDYDILPLKGGIIMLNQVIIVGRLVKTPDLFVAESGKKGSIITLAVGRAYKNQNGEYDADFLDCTLWTGIAENTAEYCKKGDIIGIRGRLQSRIIEKEDGSKYKKMEIVADKVTFLSSNKPDNGPLESIICQETEENNEDIEKKENKNTKKK